MSAHNYLPSVKDQYEGYPYPERHPEDEKNRLIFPILGCMDAVNHHCFRGRQSFENFHVLVAGGGTGDSTIWWAEQLRDKKGSSVTYIDLSSASMGIAKERARIRHLDNITWLNDSLLSIASHGMFDFIDCGGVLHHLADPDAGLKALKSVLKPGGAMHVMVYAPYARAGVYQVQALLRLLNGTTADPQQMVTQAKAMLASLPGHHTYNILKTTTQEFADTRSDAGIYDLFLHSQDRAYTILEVHDWLERAGMRMAAEPGSRYMQEEYQPQAFIKDKVLLEKISVYPLKNQQAIAEAMSGRIAKHEFFAVDEKSASTAASCHDMEMVPAIGMHHHFTLQQLAEAVKGKTERTYAEVSGQPATRVFVPAVKHGMDILNRIDGQKSIGEIVADIEGDRNEILRDFEAIFTDLNRGHMLYLRHPSVAPFLSVTEIQQRFVKLHLNNQ